MKNMVRVSDYYNRIPKEDREKLLDATRLSIFLGMLVDDVPAEKIAQYIGVSQKTVTVYRELHQAIEDDDPTVRKTDNKQAGKTEA